jgi:EmrB/QacA subfamily drug resistance transporter
MTFRFSRIPYRWQVGIVFIFGLFMDIMDSTAVNVAVPRLQADFHAPLSTVEWTITGYLLSLALVIPAAGFLSDRFGTKRTFLTAMAVFLIGSALCGQARSIEQLVAFRFLQGIGGGMMTPVSTAILSRAFPGEERAKASALIQVPWILAPLSGPVVGGYLVTYASWRWIFYINLPIGIVGFILALKVLREHVEPYAQGRFDLLGLITGGGGVAMVLFALSQAASEPWTSATVAGWGLGGIACLIVFCLIELRARPPLLDLRLFKLRLFTFGTLVSSWANASYGGFILLLTLFLQDLQGRSPVQAGLIQAPSTLGSTVSVIFAARIYRRVGPRRMMVAGFTLTGLMLLPFLLIDERTAALPIVAILCLRGLAPSVGFTASQTIVYGPLDDAQQGPASSIFNTNRQIAASLGVALLATVQASRYRSHLADALAAAHVTEASKAMITHAQVLSFHDAFLGAAAMMLFSGLLSLFISDRKAQEAMQKRVRTGVERGAIAEAAPAGSD